MKIKVLSMLITICMVIGMIPAANAEGIEDYPTLTFGQWKTLVCGNDEVYLTFTPERDGNYRISASSAAGDTIGRLYDTDMTLLDDNDD